MKQGREGVERRGGLAHRGEEEEQRLMTLRALVTAGSEVAADSCVGCEEACSVARAARSLSSFCLARVVRC
jgi:hypothetical protein